MSDLIWHIDTWKQSYDDCTEQGISYTAHAAPEKVLAYLEKVVREAVAAMYFDGDNAEYEILDQMDDPWNPGYVVMATDGQNGPLVASAIAYATVAIDL